MNRIDICKREQNMSFIVKFARRRWPQLWR